MHALLVGYGFAAQRLKAAFPFVSVVVTTRSEDRAVDISQAGLEAVTYDAGAPPARLLEAAAEAEAVLVSAPPGEAGCGVCADLGATLAKSDRLQWLGYLSTTGVYGDRRGGWAFEGEAPTPMSARAERRVLAETAWLGALPQARVFRLPGIYGPGRSQLDRARAGTARRVVAPNLVMNRIHVDDLAEALAASLRAAPRPRIFNVADDHPAPPADVAAHACRLVGAAVPDEVPLERSDLTGLAREFYSESKRVSNARLKAATGWRPAYPSYVQGLAAVLEAERGAGG
ncbi:MAG: hypothetical protein PVI23_14265 [Maricaulaceae bacterium]|jgi:nucleoside-diphosphate-sugar epimerase